MYPELLIDEPNELLLVSEMIKLCIDSNMDARCCREKIEQELFYDKYRAVKTNHHFCVLKILMKFLERQSMNPEATRVALILLDSTIEAELERLKEHERRACMRTAVFVVERLEDLMDTDIWHP